MPPAIQKRYLVCGVGFLGSHIVDTLLARGEERITLLDANFNAYARSAYADDKRIKMISGVDIADASAVMAVFTAGFDVVINTVAKLSFNERLRHQYKASYLVNVLGVRNLLQAAQATGVSVFIHTSTSHVHLGMSYLSSLVI